MKLSLRPFSPNAAVITDTAIPYMRRWTTFYDELVYYACIDY